MLPIKKSPIVGHPPVKTFPTQPQQPPPQKVVATDLQKAVVNILVGDDGKDHDTYVLILVKDGNGRVAACYGSIINGRMVGMSSGEYFTGENETLPLALEASVPTGEIKWNTGLPIPVTREANLSDFTEHNGGSVELSITPTGHDTWKIQSFSLTMIFGNDPATEHKITWPGTMLTQDSRHKTFEFDSGFNVIG